MRNIELEEYSCFKCGEVWEYFSEDYDEREYPIICPLCNMPIKQMIKDIWSEEKIKGIPFILRILLGKLK